MSLQRSDTCENCGAPTPGAYCASCGQRNLTLHTSVRALLAESFEELFGADSRILRTLVALFFRPGRLSREYRAGRRTHYTSPVKLYLAASALFFFVGWSRVSAHVGIDLPAPNAEHDAKDIVQVRGSIDEIRSSLSRFGRLGARLADQLARVASTDPAVVAEAKRDFREAFTNGMPRALILLLPAFALLLLGLYRRDRFYIDHLIFVMHLHAAFFCWATAALWMPAGHWLGLWCALAAVYLLVALHTMYGDGWMKTVLKTFVFGMAGLFLLGGAMAGLAALDFFLF